MEMSEQAKRTTIRRILREDWDPIGVKESLEAPDDEYDFYIDGVISLLRSNASAEDIAEHLLAIEKKEMHLGDLKGRRALCLNVGQHLLAAWAESE
jgi:hypothetical protein